MAAKEAGIAKNMAKMGEAKEKVNKSIVKCIKKRKAVMKEEPAIKQRNSHESSNAVEKDTEHDKQVGVKEGEPIKQRRSKKATKVAKDSKRPKRSLSAFFIFMDDFRKSFKEDHPEAKGVGVVARSGADKWKKMSEFEKAPYIAKAQAKKQEYDIAMLAYMQEEDEI